MSVVTVQLGQCGNQIGTQLFTTLYEDACSGRRPETGSLSPYCQTSLDRFFYDSQDIPSSVASRDHKLQARAVLVDMESKVVNKSLVEAKHGSGLWEFDKKSVYTQRRGSGNNWANGYFNHAPLAKEDICELIRRQVERCHHFDGFLILMSVAGGTGSGVGAHVTETLRDAYPHSTLVNQIVWPYESGEVIVQDYNTLLTTSHLQSSSDAVILMENDHLHTVCSQLLRMKKVSFADINKVICHSLASILQPCIKLEHYRHLRGNEKTHTSKSSSNLKVEDPLLFSYCSLSELQSQLTPHPDYKLLSVKTIPQIPESSQAYSRYLWSGLLKQLRQMVVTDSATEHKMDWYKQLDCKDHGNEGNYKCGLGSSYKYIPNDHHGNSGSQVTNRLHGINKSLSNILILRGNELDDVDTGPITDMRLYSRGVPTSCTCSVWCSPRGFNRYEKSCTMIGNSQSCVRPVDCVCRKAWNMFTARAYVHQYEQYGLTHEEFLDCFVTFEQMIKNYATIL